MRLLIDRCLPRAVTARLRAEGHDVSAIGERLDDPGDRAILEEAAAERRVILTIDADFGALVFQERMLRVGVLRLLERSPAAQAERTTVLLEAHGEALAAGAFVTDDGDRVRITPPP